MDEGIKIQKEINNKYLLDIIDKCLLKLDPNFIGTWQMKAERLLQIIEEQNED